MAADTDNTLPQFAAGQTVRLTLAIVGDDNIPVGTTGEITEVLTGGTLRVQFGDALVGGVQPADVELVETA